MPRAIDICTGAGGLALGMHAAGFQHLAVIEIDKSACAALTRNRDMFGLKTVIAPTDVKTFNFSRYRDKVDLISAGVPCQPFSQAGLHLGHVDDRNLFPVVVDAVRHIAPEIVLVENVYALLRPRFSRYLEYIERQLRTPEIVRRDHERWPEHLTRLRAITPAAESATGLTYAVTRGVIQAADYGVPQMRSRVFIVAFRSDLHLRWTRPSEDEMCNAPKHSEAALLYGQWVDGSYWKEHSLHRPREVPKHLRERVRALMGNDRPLTQRWRTVRDAFAGLGEPSESGTPLYPDHMRQAGARRYDGHSGSPLDWPAKTLKAGVHGVAGGENMLRHPNGKVRYFTMREAARLQTFPDSYDFGGCRWGLGLRQMGNAVPVRLAQVVGEQLLRSLRGATRTRATRSA